MAIGVEGAAAVNLESELRDALRLSKSRRQVLWPSSSQGLALLASQRGHRPPLRSRAGSPSGFSRPRWFELSPQLTAFFTSAPIRFSSAAVNSFSAKEVGHMAPSSRFALSLKPNVAYLVLNFCALWKKQMTLPSFAYAGIPYQVLGERAGALALMMAWSRSAIARSRAGISAIFASTSLSPSTLPARGLRRAAAFSSWARSLIAARSSSVNPLDALPVVLLADCCVPVFAGFLSAIAKLLRATNESQPLHLTSGEDNGRTVASPRATTRAFRCRRRRLRQRGGT